MRTGPRIALLIAVAVATVGLAAPAALGSATATGDVMVAQEEPAEEVPAQPESERPIQFPLELETPYGAFGAFLLLCTAAAIALGLRNATQQLRGERPQADGSWRAR